MSDSNTSLSLDSSALSASSESREWPRAARFGFWLAFFYLLLSLVTIYGIFTLIPFIGFRVESWIDMLWQPLVIWLGTHLLHIQGIAAHPHATDSRDEALDWVAAALVTCVSAIAALATTLLSRRMEHRAAASWLRLILRLALVFLMFRYGLMKLFPLQMPPPSLAVLNEPVGNMSPLTLLWTLIGLHPGYEMLCGAIETAAAVLLIFRRTALAGGLLAIITMSNVLIFNLFFDVPVKLGAGNVLLLAVAVVAPDLPALYRFMFERRAAVLDSRWAPHFERRRSRWGHLAAEAVVVVLVLYRFVPSFWQAAEQQRRNLAHPSSLAGAWHVDRAAVTVSGHEEARPVLTGEGLPMTDLYLEPGGDTKARSSDGRLWRAFSSIDLARHRLALESGYFDGERFSAEYSVAQPDAEHMVLTPIGSAAGQNGTLRLTRVPLPSHYPLLDRGFHWVNEWGYWR